MRFVFLLLSPLLGIAQPECNLKRDTDGIRVYTCKEADEKFKSLRAEFELSNVTPVQLKAFLWDVSNYNTWQYNLVEANVIETATENELAYRALVDAPWPINNREVVAKMVTQETAQGMSIIIKTYPYTPSPPENVVRVPFFDAAWTVIKNGNGLKITYTLRIDPGGSVPAWLVNIAMADGPYVSFWNLKKQLNPQ